MNVEKSEEKTGKSIKNAKDSQPNHKEVKSKRLNLLLQPSVFEDLSKIAHMKQTSVNNLINSILRDYRENESKSIEKYNTIFGEKEGSEH